MALAKTQEDNRLMRLEQEQKTQYRRGEREWEQQGEELNKDKI